MLDFLKARLRSTPIKEDAWLRRNEERDDSVKNAQFVSFLQQSGFRKRQLNRHQKTQRLKKFIAVAAIWTLLLCFSWIAFESAAALELF